MPAASPIDPRWCAEEQTKAPMLPGGPYDDRSAILPRRRAPAIPVYDHPAQTAVMGAHHGQEALPAPSSRHTYKDDEPAVPRDSGDVEMEEPENCMPSPSEAAIGDPAQRMTDVTNTAACEYCFKIFHADKLEVRPNA